MASEKAPAAVSEPAASLVHKGAADEKQAAAAANDDSSILQQRPQRHSETSARSSVKEKAEIQPAPADPPRRDSADAPPPAFDEIVEAPNGEESPSTGEEDSGRAVPEKLPKGQMIIIVCSLCMCTLVAAMDQSILTTALPAITGNFDSASGYTWIGSAYLLMSAALLPSWGKFSDIFGRKPVLLTASAIFMIGSIICAAAKNIEVLIFGRAVQGLGAGGSFGMVNLTISDLVAPRERGFYLSFVGMTWTLASCLGPVLGGALTQEVSWRLCFWINVPIGGLSMLGILLFLHLDSPKIPLMKGLKMVDWMGSAACLAGTVLFLISIELGGIYYQWDSPLVICLLIAGIGFLGLFIYIEYKWAANPLMPLRLFNNRTTIACYLVDLFHGIAFMGATYFLPLFFQSVRAASPLLSGVLIFPYLVTSSVLSAITGALISKTGKVREYVWAGMFLITIGSGLLSNLDRGSNWAKIVLFQMVLGAGTAPNFQSPLILIQSSVANKDLATATATYMFIRNIACALGVSLGMVVFQNGMAEQHKHLNGHLGSDAANIISGKYASASVDFIQDLPSDQRNIARDAYAVGLQDMWYFYLAASAVGFIASGFIGRTVLSKKLESSQPALRKRRKKTDSNEDGAEAEA